MNIGQILTRLRSERRAIDRAIVALEKIETKPHVTKRKGGELARKRATPLQLPTARRAQIIDFPRSERTG